jgi:hypothetical protein
MPSTSALAIYRSLTNDIVGTGNNGVEEMRRQDVRVLAGRLLENEKGSYTPE